MNKIINQFISEQDGDVEREFKMALNHIFFELDIPIRSYLTKIQYKNSTTTSVALCIKSDSDFDESLIEQCSHIFKSIFASDQSLDIVFITNAQEQKIRQICCPFYTSEHFRVSIPDFYLVSSEGYHLGEKPISCYKHKRLYGGHVDGYILCDITPAIIGQQYGLGADDINQIIIASRFENMSLFPIVEWPTYVYVARPLISNIDLRNSIEKPDTELIAWAEIYRVELTQQT